MFRWPTPPTTPLVIRSLVVLTVSISQGLAAAAGADATAAPGILHCESQASPGDTRDILCALNASGTPQRLRFKANFSGGHDDTMASMTAILNEAPLVCEKGSKTSLMGEDGDVSLECKFSIAGKAGTRQVLKVKLLWSHAQYTDFELDPE